MSYGSRWHDPRMFLGILLAACVQVDVAETVDVFLLSGQSNMQGIGKVAELPSDWVQSMPGVYFWNGKEFEILDPKSSKISGRAGEFGPELGFAQGMRRAGFTRDLYLVKFYRSGQPLHFSLSNNKWVSETPGPGRANFYPGERAGDENVGNHYVAWLQQCRNAMAALKAARKIPKLRGLVWMQGEADSKFEQSAVNYAQSMRQLRSRLLGDLKEDLGIGMYSVHLPMIYGQVLPFEPAMERFKNRTEVRQQMAALDQDSGLAEATVGMRMVATEGMPLKKDTVHYNSQGQQQLGVAFANAMMSQLRQTPEALADDWQLRGIAINEPGYHVWGSSPIMDETGRVHLFAARWPVAASFVPGWHTACEIAHYIGAGPEGPFKFSDVVARGDGDGWNKQGIHNPHISKVGDRFVLTFIGNTGVDFPASQTIGMLVADNLNGPWKPANGDANQPMLAPPNDPSIWCYDSGCGVNNPSLFKHSDGRFYLYFKSKSGRKSTVKMGVAIADQLEGPYIIQPKPITSNDRIIEDGYAFQWRNQICLITTDNHGMIENGGGLLWTSTDGLNFAPQPMKAFHHFGRHYFPNGVPKNSRAHYTNQVKFERPQLLMIDGEPRYLYVPSGRATDGSDGTNNYFLRRLHP